MVAAMRRSPVLTAVLALLLWAAPTGAEAQSPAAPGSGPGDAVAQDTAHDPAGQAVAGHADACDPAVAEALAASAEAGVEADLAVIRHEEQGIRNPDSILDFSCITDLFDYRSFDIHFDPAGALEHILDLARRRICTATRDAYRRYVGRALDPSVYVSEYTRPLDRLPGLDIDWPRRNVFGDIGADDAGNELFRGVVGGRQ